MLSHLRNRAGRRLREPFGKAGLTVAMIALVFAMLGGAYAASGNGGGKALASKAKAGPRGPRGKTGPAGPAGPAGPQGPAGANGKDGSNGSNGEKGAKGDQGIQGEEGIEGEAGESPVGEPFTGADETPPNEGPCDGAGGVEYEVESTEDSQTVCNGKEGSPWTLGNTLPADAYETGFWYFEGGPTKFTAEVEGTPTEITIGSESVVTPISFPVPLPAPITSGQAPTHIHYIVGANPTTECPGNFEFPFVGEDPANPGHLFAHTLCVYQNEVKNGAFVFVSRVNGNGGASRNGAGLNFTMTAAGSGYGGWAVSGG